jgi:hypothetical protein
MPEIRARRCRRPGRLAALLLLVLSACAQPPVVPHFAATSGPTSRLLMRGSLEPGDTYGVYLLDGVQDCTQPQRVGTGTAESNPAATTIAANRLSTLDVVVTKSNRTFCRVRWSFSPRAGRSYLVAARGEPGGCSVSLLDATDPDDIRTELSARRRDAPGNSCIPLAAAKTVGELAARSQGLATSTDRQPSAARSSGSELPSAVSEDDLKGLTGK